MAIERGAVAPDFELPSNELTPEGKPGKKIKLSDYRGKKNVVLAFYPLDFSPVCTQENTCLRDDLTKFNGLDAQVLGVSVDHVWAHKAFADKLGVGYPLLADFHPRGAVAKQYGLYLEDKGFDARATVIVDKAGKVAFVKLQEIPQARDDKEILGVLASLK